MFKHGIRSKCTKINGSRLNILTISYMRFRVRKLFFSHHCGMRASVLGCVCAQLFRGTQPPHFSSHHRSHAASAGHLFGNYRSDKWWSCSQVPTHWGEREREKKRSNLQFASRKLNGSRFEPKRGCFGEHRELSVLFPQRRTTSAQENACAQNAEVSPPRGRSPAAARRRPGKHLQKVPESDSSNADVGSSSMSEGFGLICSCRRVSECQSCSI